MNKLKQNAFWIGFWVALAAVVVFFAAVVMPLMTDRSNLSDPRTGKIPRLLRELEGAVPGEPDIKGWIDYRDLMKSEYAKIVNQYKAADESLEAWFAGMEQDPPRGRFMTRYADEIKKLEEQLKAAKVTIGIPVSEADPERLRLGFNWEEPTTEHWAMLPPADPAKGELGEKGILKNLQKRFWARKRMANVILLGGVKVSRILDFRFVKALHERIPSPAWEQSAPAEVPGYPGFDVQGSGVIRNYGEYDLPLNLGKTITFCFSVELPFSEVPKFIREFLNPAGEASKDKLPVSITGSRVTIREQNDPVVRFEYPSDKPDMKKAKEDEIRKNQQSRNVLLAVTCQIIDFDASKIDTFEGKPKEAK
jgi:hypothetical protein